MRRSSWPQAVAGNNSLSFFHCVEAIGRQIVQSLSLAGGPENFYAIQVIVRTEAEVDSEIALRQITSTAADFIHLY